MAVKTNKGFMVSKGIIKEIVKKKKIQAKKYRESKIPPQAYASYVLLISLQLYTVKKANYRLFFKPMKTIF